MNIVYVEHRDSVLPCPKCKIRMIVRVDPLRPMQEVPENAEDLTGELGQAYCHDCDATYPWGYRSA